MMVDLGSRSRFNDPLAASTRRLIGVGTASICLLLLLDVLYMTSFDPNSGEKFKRPSPHSDPLKFRSAEL
jgi:hypothetical protein